MEKKGKKHAETGSFTTKNSTTPVRVRPMSNYPLIKASRLVRSPKETAELREKR
jgi:hypothetical protein